MKRTLIAVVALVGLGLATAASGATLSISADKTTYNTGETITLTVTGTTTTEAAITAIVDVGFDGTNSSNPSSVPSHPASFTTLGIITWIIGGNQGTCNGVSGANACRLVDQISGQTAPFAIDQPGFTATMLVTAGPGTGVATFTFLPSTTFFGQGGQAGTTVNVVPEPTTAALMGLGLVGLVAAGRRRRS